jgi:hypothetical protein
VHTKAPSGTFAEIGSRSLARQSPEQTNVAATRRAGHEKTRRAVRPRHSTAPELLDATRLASRGPGDAVRAEGEGLEQAASRPLSTTVGYRYRPAHHRRGGREMSDPTGPTTYGRHEQGRPHPYPTAYTPPPLPPAAPPAYAPSGPPPAFQPPPAPPTTSRRNVAVIVPWTLVGVLTVALAVTLFLWLGPSSTPGPAAAKKPATHDISVAFTLTDADTASAGCVGQGGYSDIGAGTPVTIKNGSGDILGAGDLGEGTAAGGGECVWSVKIPNVRLGESFYSAEVGRRGAITSSADELKSNGYAFDLSLGH